MRRPRLSLLARFSITSLVCLTLLGVAFGVVRARSIRGRALQDAGSSAQLLAEVGIRSALGSDASLADGIPVARRRALDRIIAEGEADGLLVRVKVWERSGRIAYSDDPAEIGRRFAVDDELAGAFAGRRHVGLADADTPEHVGEQRFGRLVEAYVPLRLSPTGLPAGAFEMYLPYAPIQAAVRHDVRETLLMLTGGLLVLWLVLFRLVAGASRRLRQHAATAHGQARHDPLTDLPNRRALTERLAATETGTRVLVLDLRGFKELNDVLGRAAGDEVLAGLGPRLAAGLPSDAVVARLDGDEFAVVLPTRTGTAREVAERLLDALAEPFAVQGTMVSVTAVVGVAERCADESPAALLRRATAALQQAKRTRQPVCEHEPGEDDGSSARLELGGELRRAIDGGELVLRYQPQLDVVSGAVETVEALVRWRHPRLGELAPDHFLGVVEQTGLMGRLTRRVLADALAQCAAWTREGVALGVAVNLSATDLLDEALPVEVDALLRRSGVEPHRLVLEVTETSVLADPSRAGGILERLRELGVGLALDDFGTGFSSLSHLRALAVDELKVDRSFVGRIVTSPADAAIVRTTTELAQALGLRVVAEGVEDEATLVLLAEMGCDRAQGYHVLRPSPPDEVARWLRDSRRASTTPPGVVVGQRHG